MKRKVKMARKGMGILRIVLLAVLAGLLVFAVFITKRPAQLSTEPAAQPSSTVLEPNLTAPSMEAITQPPPETTI